MTFRQKKISLFIYEYMINKYYQQFDNKTSTLNKHLNVITEMCDILWSTCEFFTIDKLLILSNLHGLMDSWTHGLLDSWTHGIMDSWTHAWTRGLMVWGGCKINDNIILSMSRVHWQAR